jgi:hypothetical protein
MAETKTPYLKLIQPEVGGSYDVWGNRLNSDLAIVDDKAFTSDKILFTALQNGANHTSQFKDPNDATKTYNMDNILFRTAQELLFYSDDANPKQISEDPDWGGYNKDGLLISQGFLWDLMEMVFPVGIIVPWSPFKTADGTIINPWDPEIWHLADGTANYIIHTPAGDRAVTLPDLKERFIIGANDANTAMKQGEYGGSTDHIHSFTTDGYALNYTQIPRLAVQADQSLGGGSGSLVIRGAQGDPQTQYDLPSAPGNGDSLSGTGITISGSTGTTGSGVAAAHSHPGKTGMQEPATSPGIYAAAGTNLLPPFLSLAYLIKIKQFRRFGDPVL